MSPSSSEFVSTIALTRVWMNSSDTFKAFLGFYSGSSVLGMNRPAILGHLFPFGELSLDLRLLCVSNFIGAFGDGLFVYILPNYIRGLEATSADVGFLFSLLSLTTALTIIPGGFLADRFDRKKIMILGWLVWAPLPLAFSAASHWSQLIVPMCLYGALLSGPAISAYVATTTSKERMTLNSHRCQRRGLWVTSSHQRSEGTWHRLLTCVGFSSSDSYSTPSQRVFYSLFEVNTSVSLSTSERRHEPPLSQCGDSSFYPCFLRQRRSH